MQNKREFWGGNPAGAGDRRGNRPLYFFEVILRSLAPLGAQSKPNRLWIYFNWAILDTAFSIQ